MPPSLWRAKGRNRGVKSSAGGGGGSGVPGCQSGVSGMVGLGLNGGVGPPSGGSLSEGECVAGIWATARGCVVCVHVGGGVGNGAAPHCTGGERRSQATDCSEERVLLLPAIHYRCGSP